ncbi:MAG: TatD family hydrolase [Candidatus Omnitrophica bacterium]|nr:TatD family hydrolase [Candidatus Omnitrophota bacterium]
MFDTHSHLHFSDYDSDREEVILRSRENGVKYLINVGISFEDSKKALILAQKHSFIYAAVGVHPHYSNSEKAFGEFEELVKDKKTVAIGEVGLDYFRNPISKEIQQRVFRQFVCLAKSSNLPLIIHSRLDSSQSFSNGNAYSDALKILQEEKVRRGVFHCFGGDKEIAKQILEQGFFISFTGNLTFPNAQKIREVADFIPLEKILLETDCPFLAPQQKRGKRNEPSYVKYVAETLSGIKSVSFEEVVKTTTENAKGLFEI